MVGSPKPSESFHARDTTNQSDQESNNTKYYLEY